MVESPVTCSECDTAISFESILNELLEHEAPEEILRQGSELTMACDDCDSRVSFYPSDIEIQLTVAEALEAFSTSLSEARFRDARTTDWEEIIHIQREQAKRAEEIDDLARDL